MLFCIMGALLPALVLALLPALALVLLPALALVQSCPADALTWLFCSSYIKSTGTWISWDLDQMHAGHLGPPRFLHLLLHPYHSSSLALEGSGPGKFQQAWVLSSFQLPDCTTEAQEGELISEALCCHLLLVSASLPRDAGLSQGKQKTGLRFCGSGRPL